MHLQIDRLVPDRTGRSDINLTKVENDHDLELWLDVRRQNHGMTDAEADGWRTAIRNANLDGNTRHFVAISGSQAIGTSSLHVSGTTAGIYFVDTLKPFRKKGVGTALTVRAIQEGISMGAANAVLTSSPVAESLYRSLGFEEVARYIVLVPSGQESP